MAIVPISGKKVTRGSRRGDTLATENLDLVPIVAKAVKSQLPPSFDLDDLVATGNVALLRAAREYDPDGHGGTPFRLYARMKVRGAILDSVRRRAWRENTHAELFEAPADNVIEMQIDGARLQRRVRDAVALLRPPERELVTRLYLTGLTPAQVDYRIGTLKRENRELLDRALRELRTRVAA